jgi:hypothetical protein
MLALVVFILLVYVYSLLSRRLEGRILAMPQVFTWPPSCSSWLPLGWSGVNGAGAVRRRLKLCERRRGQRTQPRTPKEVLQWESRVWLRRQGASQIAHSTGKRADVSPITGYRYTALRLKGDDLPLGELNWG